MTKEELIKDNEKLERAVVKAAADDRELRQEFAKAFGWGKQREPYYRTPETEWDTPSWQQVFVKIGELLATKKVSSLEDRIAALEAVRQELLARIEELTPKV